MSDILITNNSLVRAKYAQNCRIEFIDGGLKEVLEKARDQIHLGHRLLSHPLSGSVKPNENPFKSILISKDKGSLDVDSLRIIENAIVTAAKFPLKYACIPDEILADFRTIDCSLITGAFLNKM